MEVRIIKTCHGFEEVKFLDGALLPMGESPKARIIDEMSGLTEADYDALNQLTARLLRQDRPRMTGNTEL